ncbi:MAG: ABC transporter permease [Thermomicrobiales bacterium]
MAAVMDPAVVNVTLAQPERHRSNTQRAIRRFFRQKLAVFGLGITLALVLIALLAPFLGSSQSNLMDSNQFPSAKYPFGTDQIGKDSLSRVAFGLRTSLLVGFSAVAVACAIGITLGLIAGLKGGAADFIILRIVEVMTAFPGILFAIFLVTILGNGVRNIIIVIGLTSWVTLCRLTRGQLLTLREQEYVQAARSLGAKESQIALRHLLPNALPPLIVAITLAIPAAIFAEAALSYIGIGINEPTASLGKMVADSAAGIRVFWHLALFPTLVIALAMLGFTFIGDGLRDALDPKQN